MCSFLTPDTPSHQQILEKLNLIEQLFDHKPYCYELKIKGLLCQIFSDILFESQNYSSHYTPSNQLELERLEQMLNYLNTHFDSVISLQQLADHVHLSREVCCRLFKKMTGKTITAYLEEYRAKKELLPGTKRAVFHDSDCCHGRFQQCQPFCQRIPQIFRLQSRCIQFSEKPGLVLTQFNLC